MIVIDVETSGLFPDKNSILSVGAIEYENHGNWFYQECRPWDGAEITDKALEVNGFTREYIEKVELTPGELCLKLVEWMGGVEDITYAGYNVAFDHGFMKAQFERSGIKWPFGFRWVDAHSVAYFAMDATERPLYHRNSSLSLDKALEFNFLEPEQKPHNSLVGAQKVFELLRKIKEE